MPRKAKFRRAIPVLFCLWCGCAPALIVRSLPAKPLADAWGIAVYPVNLEFQAPASESYARAASIADGLAESTGLRIYGPGEFDVRSFDRDDLRFATDLFSRIRYSKVRLPEGLYGLRVTVLQQVSVSTAAAVDARSGKSSSRKEETIEVKVRAELLSMAVHTVVAELEGRARIDPFAMDTDQDAYPEITNLTTRLVAALVDRSGLHAAQAPPDTGLRLAEVPGPALSYVGSMNSDHTRKDPLEQEARLLHIVRTIDPEATRERERLYKHEPYGLVVLGVSGPAIQAGLEPGDLLLEANGARLYTRSALLRELEDGPVHLHVKRAQEEREVDLKP